MLRDLFIWCDSFKTKWWHRVHQGYCGKGQGGFLSVETGVECDQVNKSTKIRLYKTLTWKMNQRDDIFHNNSLKRIIKIRCQDHVEAIELLQHFSVEFFSVEEEDGASLIS